MSEAEINDVIAYFEPFHVFIRHCTASLHSYLSVRLISPWCNFRSNIDRITNQRIIFLFFVLVGLAVISAIGAHFYELDLLSQAYYLGFSGAYCLTSVHLPG